MRYWLWILVLSFGLLVGGTGIADFNQTITDDIDPVGITEGPDPIPGAICRVVDSHAGSSLHRVVNDIAGAKNKYLRPSSCSINRLTNRVEKVL